MNQNPYNTNLIYLDKDGNTVALISNGQLTGNRETAVKCFVEIEGDTDQSKEIPFRQVFVKENNQ